MLRGVSSIVWGCRETLLKVRPTAASNFDDILQQMVHNKMEMQPGRDMWVDSSEDLHDSIVSSREPEAHGIQVGRIERQSSLWSTVSPYSKATPTTSSFCQCNTVPLWNTDIFAQYGSRASFQDEQHDRTTSATCSPRLPDIRETRKHEHMHAERRHLLAVLLLPTALSKPTAIYERRNNLSRAM